MTSYKFRMGKVKLIYLFLQFTLLVTSVTTAMAESSCIEWVSQLKSKNDNIVLNGGMWGYFEKDSELRKRSVSALQLDSRVNKIFFALDHLCETQDGIPLNDLALYIAYNLSQKSKDAFRDELLVLGKTKKQIDTWFEFDTYAQHNKSRTLELSKIKTAVDQSTSLINSYVQLAEIISGGSSPDLSLQKALSLQLEIDQLLKEQPYLAQALEEISEVPYWDINESSGGS